MGVNITRYSLMAKLNTKTSKLFAGLLFPLYSLGVLVMYISDVLEDTFFTPTQISTLIYATGKSMCYPSVYVAENL